MAGTRGFHRDSGRSPGGKELAGAAALVGTAAVGGKVAWDRLSSSDGRSDGAYRLRADEPVGEGVRRIARGQLDEAGAELGGASKRKLPAAVHDTRKRLKRLRACVRLARGGLGDEVYTEENTAFRDAGRRLTGARDATVLIETLDGLESAAGPELPSGVTAELRARLEREREDAVAVLRGDDATIAAVLGDLETARTRTATWTFDTDGFDALEHGLRRVYRRGRRAMRRAAKERTTENLHEWRKRVKDLWHTLQILRLADPKRMRKLAKRSHRLSDLLGDDHDLAELGRYAETHPGLFGDSVAESAVFAVIDRRRAELQRRALKLGSRVYSRPPKRFVEAVGRGWRRNARPVAS